MSQNIINSLLNGDETVSRSRESAGLAQHNLLITQGLILSENAERRAQQSEAKAKAEVSDLEGQLAHMRRLYAEAQNTVKEWQASHDAWRDLAQTLRDEAKACPNAEAHRFGKDDALMKTKKILSENNKRLELGLKPWPSV